MANASIMNFFCCDTCGEWMTKENETILRHFNQKHKSEGRGKFPCAFCTKNFTRKWTLSRHIVNIHKHQPLSLPGLIYVPNSTVISTKKYKKYWPTGFHPLSIQICILYGNNSPYPSCLQPSVNHPPRQLTLTEGQGISLI